MAAPTVSLSELKRQLRDLRGVVDNIKCELFPRGFSPKSRHTRSARQAPRSRAQILFEQFEQRYSDLEDKIERFTVHQTTTLGAGEPTGEIRQATASEQMHMPSAAPQLYILPPETAQDPFLRADSPSEQAHDPLIPCSTRPESRTEAPSVVGTSFNPADEPDPSSDQANNDVPSSDTPPTPQHPCSQEDVPSDQTPELSVPWNTMHDLHELEAICGSTDGSETPPELKDNRPGTSYGGTGSRRDELTVVSPAGTFPSDAAGELNLPEHSGTPSSPGTERWGTPASSVQTQPTSIYAQGSPDTREACPSGLPEEQATVSINRDEMGESLVSNLTTLVCRRDCSQLIKVIGPPIDLVNLDHEAVLFTNPDYRANVYRAINDQIGCSYLEISRRRADFRWPDFTKIPSRPTEDEVIDFVEAAITQPPSSSVPYYGGEASVPFDRILHAGETLAGCKYLTVANAEYYHIGEKGSGSPFHHEDANFWSCNLTEGGWKIFIVIKDTMKFESFIKDTWTCRECDQFVRHLNLIVAPSRLQAEGIDYQLICAGPGDLVVTQPGIYHACINYSACFARSINFLLPDEPLLPTGLSVCDDCGLNGLQAHYDIRHVSSGTTKKRKATEPSKSKPSKISRSESKELNEVIASIKRADPLCLVPQLHNRTVPAADVLKLAASVRSRQAIRQFVNLVDASRTTGRQALPNGAGINERLKSRILRIQSYDKGRLFSKYQLRFQRIALVRDLEASKTSNIRLSGETIDRVCAEVGWSRNDFKNNKDEGSKWEKISGRFEGILPFIPLSKPNSFNINTSDFTKLTEPSRNVFHDLLDDSYTQQLCTIGAAFETSLRNGQSIKFAWEGRTVDWEGVASEELFNLLAIEPAQD